MQRLLPAALTITLALTAPAAGQFFPQPQPPRDERQAMYALVDSWYQRFFGRRADREGSENWLTALRVGMPPAMTLSVFLSTEEYYLRAGNSPEGLVHRLFVDVVNREPAPEELHYWLRRQGESDRPDFIYRFLKRHPLSGSGPNTVVSFPELGCQVCFESNGLCLRGVSAGSVAASLSLRTGDYLYSVNGTRVYTLDQFRASLAAVSRPLHSLVILRNNQPFTATVRYVNRQLVVVQGVQQPNVVLCPPLGCYVCYEPGGIRIQTLPANSVAALAGLQPGDLLWAVEGYRVRTVDELQNAFLAGAGGGRYRLSVRRRDEQMLGYVGYTGNRLVVRGRLRFLDDDDD